MNRLIVSLEAGLSIGACLGVIYLFMQLTHLMWASAPAGIALPSSQLALLAAQHHGITLLAMLLGGIMGMMSAFTVQEPRARQQALTMTFMPLPVLATMALAIWLAPHHAVGVAAMAVVMGLGTWGRRFIPKIGPRAFLYGALLFVGYMIGFLSNGALEESYLGDLAIVLYVACAVAFLIKLGFANPLARSRLARTTMAFRARCRGVMAATLALYDAHDADDLERARRRLHRSLNRLNETALVIDASLAQAESTRRRADANDIHDELFTLELIVQNIARISERLATADLPEPLWIEIRGWLDEMRRGRIDRVARVADAFEDAEADGLLDGVAPDDRARVHRLAMTIRRAADAVRVFPQTADADSVVPTVAFSSPVTLIFGDLPGSALVAARVATPAGDRSQPWWRRLPPPSQAAIRMTIAVGVAGGIGSIISERRFYWAVIAVFITFMGTNTSGEQMTKAVHRVLGTVVGILIGSLLAHAIGHSTWSIAVVIGALMIGMYFMKLSYGIFVIAITITVAQLYVQLGEYSNSLLALRLGETALGAVIAVISALVIFPVPTRRVVNAAAIGYLNALSDVLTRVQSRLSGERSDERLTTSVRALDYAAQQFVAASKPLRATPFRPASLEHNVALLSQTAHQARNIAAEVQRHANFAPVSNDWLEALVYTERAAVTRLTDTLEGTGGPAPVIHRVDDTEIAALDRALIEAHVGSGTHQRRLLFQLDRLDETLAELHENVASMRS